MQGNLQHFILHLTKSLLAGALVLVTFAAVWLMASESGLYASVDLLNQQLPGTIDTTNLHGSWITTITADNVTYTSEAGESIVLDGLKFSANLKQLITSQMISLNQATVKTVVVTQKKRPWSPQIPVLPLINPKIIPHFTIQKAAIDKIIISQPSKVTQTFEKTTLSGIYTQKTVNINFHTKNSALNSLDIIGKAQGSPEKFAIDWTLKNDYLTLAMTGVSNHGNLKLTLPETNTTAGTLAMEVAYNPTTPSLVANIYSNKINLNKLNPSLFGSINSKATLNLGPEDGTLEISELKGRYNQQPLDAKLLINLKRHQITHLKTSSTLGKNSLNANFNGADQTLKWQINIQHLHQIIPSQSGEIITRGQISPKALNFSLLANQLDLQQWHVKSANLSVLGTPKRHIINAEIRHGDENWQLETLGEWLEGAWRATVSRFTLASNRLGVWQLEQATQLTLRSHQATITPFCWRNESSSLCGHGTWSREKRHWQGQLEGKNIDLGPWSRTFAKDTQLTGVSDFTLHADLNNHMPKASAHLVINNGQLTDGNGLNLAPPFEQITTETTLNHQGLSSKVRSLFKEAPELTASVSLPNFDPNEMNPKQKIKANLNWQTDKLGWLKLIGFHQPEGKLDLQLRASGRLNQPSIYGKVKIEQGAFLIPGYNLHITDTNLDIEAQGNHFELSGDTSSGQGTLAIEGTSRVRDGDIISQVSASGDNFTILNTPELKLTASPKLTIMSQNSSFRITGKAHIPQGKIAYQDFSNTVTLPDDVVFTHESSHEQSRATLSHHIEVTLGDNVKFDTYGIKSLLSGEIILHKIPYHTTMVDGQLHMHEGVYSIYGINLNIDNGILNYTNTPIDSPWINLSATRSIEQMKTSSRGPDKVGIKLEGPVDKLTTTYFSEPPNITSQQDLLAYLIVGKSSASNLNSSNKNALIFKAIQSYGAEKTGTLGYTMRQIRSSLNLNEFELNLDTTDPFAHNQATSDQDSYTSLQLGKKISSKLYIHTDIGMPVGSLTLIYQLAKRWALHINSTYGWSYDNHPLETGADLFYNF